MVVVLIRGSEIFRATMPGLSDRATRLKRLIDINVNIEIMRIGTWCVGRGVVADSSKDSFAVTGQTSMMFGVFRGHRQCSKNSNEFPRQSCSGSREEDCYTSRLEQTKSCVRFEPGVWLN